MQLFPDLSLCSMVEVAVVTALFLAARKRKQTTQSLFLATFHQHVTIVVQDHGANSAVNRELFMHSKHNKWRPAT
jgi:hypothetical protein